MILLSNIDFLDLRQGLTKNKYYNAFKFPGGEIHFKMENYLTDYFRIQKPKDLKILVNLKSSDDIMLLAIVCDTIRKSWDTKIHVVIPYMAYQQADRDFAEGECFSLATFTKILGSLPINEVTVLDPHSDITGALITAQSIKFNVISNVRLTIAALQQLRPAHKMVEPDNLVSTLMGYYDATLFDDLAIVSPDAGAYKKIFKLAESIKWQGAIETANKYRDTTNGELQIRLSNTDFDGKDVLIIDDICIGGRTFIELAKALKAANVGKIYLSVTHGIFSNRFNELAEHLNGIFTSDSWRTKEEIENMRLTSVTDANWEGFFVNVNPAI